MLQLILVFKNTVIHLPHPTVLPPLPTPLRAVGCHVGYPWRDPQGRASRKASGQQPVRDSALPTNK